MSAPVGLSRILHRRRGGTSGLWTPASASPLLWFDSELSCPTSGAVATATDAAGSARTLTQATGSKQPVVDAAQLLGGHRGLRFTAASQQGLATATGGVSGSGAHTLYVVGQLSAVPSTYETFAMFGQSTAASFIGPQGTGNGNGIFYGRYGAGGPASNPGSTPHDGPCMDTYPHIFAKTVGSGVVNAWLDGVQVVSAYSDASYNNAAGLAIGSAFASSFYLDGWEWAAVFRSGVDDAATMARHIRFLSAKYKLYTWIGLGDSLTFGYPDGAPGVHDYISYALPHCGLGGGHYNFGATGETSAEILARVSSVTALASSGNAVVVLQCGTNDWFKVKPYIAPSATLANMQSMASAIRAAWAAAGGSVKIIVWPVLPCGPSSGKPGTFDTDRATFNALLAASWSSFADGYVDLLSDSRLTDPTNTEYFKADQIHPTVGAGDGYDVIGQLNAATAKTLLGIS